MAAEAIPNHPDGREGRQALRAAVFLDRDGTVIDHVHYIADPADVRLKLGAGPALRRLAGAGYALVVVTNQSAIGRGMITLEQYHSVDDEMARQLAEEGVGLDGVYYCPEVPTVDDRTTVTHGDRKPGPGMLLRASADLGLDPSRSWMIGDMISDALAGINAGCRGSFLLGVHELPNGAGYSLAPDLLAVADAILGPLDDRSTSRRDHP